MDTPSAKGLYDTLKFVLLYRRNQVVGVPRVLESHKSFEEIGIYNFQLHQREAAFDEVERMLDQTAESFGRKFTVIPDEQEELKKSIQKLTEAVEPVGQIALLAYRLQKRLWYLEFEGKMKDKPVPGYDLIMTILDENLDKYMPLAEDGGNPLFALWADHKKE